MSNSEFQPADLHSETILNSTDIDLAKIASPTLLRIIEEVRNEEDSTTRAFDRVHNRHNR